MSTRNLTIEITGMHCPSCGLLVDDCVSDVVGVLSTETSVKHGRSIVAVADWVSDAHVLAAVSEAGYVGRIVASNPL